MTEDDTFRILTRISLNEMLKIIDDMPHEMYADDLKFEKMLNFHGWARKELSEAIHSRIMNIL